MTASLLVIAEEVSSRLCRARSSTCRFKVFVVSLAREQLTCNQAAIAICPSPYYIYTSLLKLHHNLHLNPVQLTFSIYLLLQHSMTDYTSLTTDLLSLHPIAPTLSSYRTAIRPQLSTLITVSPLPPRSDAQLDYFTLVLAIKINEEGPPRGFPLSPEDLRMATIPAVRGVGSKIGLKYVGKDDEWIVALGLEKVVYADAVRSFVVVVEEIGREYLRSGELAIVNSTVT